VIQPIRNVTLSSVEHIVTAGVNLAFLWATLLPLAGRAMAQTTATLQQEEPVQVTVTEIHVTRTIPGPVLGRYETSVTTGSRLYIQYFVGVRHCSSIRLHIYLDGKLILTTYFLGWPSRGGGYCSVHWIQIF
jgi:hypothetical protein